MNWITSKLARLGDYLVSLSNRTRLRLVVSGLLLLGGGAVYKLINSIQKLQQPLPVATPAQLIKPMEGLIKQTSNKLSDYQTERSKSFKKLDSLKFYYTPKKNNER